MHHSAYLVPSFRRSALLLLLAVPLLACGSNTAHRHSILILGDSLSAAHNIPLERGWVALLQRRLGQGYRIINAAISGETSDGALTRLPALLAAHQPGLVLLELGANDGLRGQPLGGTRANLAGMIQLSRKSGARILLLGVELPVNYGSAYRQRFRQMYVDLSHGYDIPLVPFILRGVALHPELMQADGLHPTAAAQARVLNNIWAVLAPMLQADARQHRMDAPKSAHLDNNFKRPRV